MTNEEKKPSVKPEPKPGDETAQDITVRVDPLIIRALSQVLSNG